jgi:hypothetical protein
MPSILGPLSWAALLGGAATLLISLGWSFRTRFSRSSEDEGAAAVSQATFALFLGISIGAWGAVAAGGRGAGFGLLLGTTVAAAAGRMGLGLERARLRRGLSGTPRKAAWIRIFAFFLAAALLSVALGPPGPPRWTALGGIAGLAALCSVGALLPRVGGGAGGAVALRFTCFASAGAALATLAWALVRRWSASPGILVSTTGVATGAAWADVLLALVAWIAGTSFDRGPGRTLPAGVRRALALVGGLSGLAGLCGRALV